MELSESLRTLYSETIEQRDGEYQITVPAREIESGSLEIGETYRVAVISSSSTAETSTESTDQPTSPSAGSQQSAGPPVEEGDRCEVEIEAIGEQGDGIAKIERGYVVIVPDTRVGDYVTVEIDRTQENVAFATVVDRNPRGI
ncbi:TRAM domain-containing protein [Halorubrum aethiopicum]|uniref:TRAM domain-containing protein n=1 Tax=Halorubrum aethiopicum TaxID=1758255 RepID=UPI0009B5CF17|nr:TRAM domain-containing protein [Halorubrum aethiopicum]